MNYLKKMRHNKFRMVDREGTMGGEKFKTIERCKMTDNIVEWKDKV